MLSQPFHKPQTKPEGVIEAERARPPRLEDGAIVGDPLVWAVRERHGAFQRLAAAFVGQDASEDVVQGAYIKVFSDRRLQTDNPAMTVAYIKRAVFWSAARFLRDEHRRAAGIQAHIDGNGAESLVSFGSEGRPQDPARLIEESDLIDKAFQVISGLERVSDVQRARAGFFKKRYLEDLSFLEISQSSGASQGTVFSGLHRITSELQARMKELAA